MKILNEKDLTFVGEVEKNTLVLGDCLNAMKYLSDKSIDMIIADLPYS